MKRRGITLVETVVAAAMLAMLLSVCLKMTNVVATGRKANHLRQTALQETANTMEHLAVLTWDQLSSDRVEQVRLDAMAQSVLPEPAVEISIAEPPGETEAKRVSVSIGWSTSQDTAAAPIKLTAWRYAPVQATATDAVSPDPNQSEKP